MMRFLKTLSPKRPLAVTVLIGLSLGACAAEPRTANFNPDQERAVPNRAVRFENINPAIQMGGAWGDRSQGAHGTFGKFPANFETPFHTHSGAYHGVVLAGTMTNPFASDKSDRPEMSPGSYWYVPAGSVHATACVSDTPCAFYFHASSGFDFQPVE